MKMRRMPARVMPSPAISDTRCTWLMSLRLYRRCPPSERAGCTTFSTSTRRRNAGWTPSIPATWPTVYSGACSSSNGSDIDQPSSHTGGHALLGLRVDRGLHVLADVDRHTSRLGLLRDRKPQGQHAVGVLGVNTVGVERLAQEQLTAERPVRPLTDQQLDPVGLGPLAFGMDRQHVLLDRQVNRLGLDAGKIELHHELFAVAVRVDGHRRRPGRGAERLLGESVEVTERVGTHQHRWPPCRLVCTNAIPI